MSSVDVFAVAARVESVRRELVNQAFQVTGLKISEDDPLIVALMMQATYMAEAAEIAAAQIEAKTKHIAEDVRRLEALVNRAEAGVADRAADIRSIRDSLAGIHKDLRETPAYPGWMSNLGLALTGAFVGAIVALVTGHWLGWLL